MHVNLEKPLSTKGRFATTFKLEFSNLKYLTRGDYRAIHKNFMQFVLRQNYRILNGGRLLDMITLGIARISTSSSLPLKNVLEEPAQLDIRLDEPLAIAALLKYYCNDENSECLEDYVASESLDYDSPGRGSTYENATMIILAKILDGTRTLDDIFDFRNRGDLPDAMWHGRVQLVSILGWDGHQPTVCDAGMYKGASPILGFWAKNPEDVMEWSKGSGIPFLFPDNNMGPDVWALLKVGNQLLWLSVQDKCLAKVRLRHHEIMKGLKTTTPEFFYINVVCYFVICISRNT
jgi:hypothetical protein